MNRKQGGAGGQRELVWKVWGWNLWLRDAGAVGSGWLQGCEAECAGRGGDDPPY